MRLRRSAIAYCLVLSAACSGKFNSVPASSAQIFRGWYASGFETESFQPCDTREQWWVIAPGSLTARYDSVAQHGYQEIFVVVRGDTSGLGRVGHLGQYDRYLTVREVIEVHAPGRGTCRP